MGLVIGGSIALVLLVLCYFSPHIAAYQLKRAAEANDIDALKEQVDFPAVRESVKEWAQEEMAKKQAAKPKTNENPFEELGSAFAGGFVNAYIESMLTPKNLAHLIRGEHFDVSPIVNGFSAFNKALGGGVVTPPPEPRRCQPQISSMRYESLSRFKVGVTNLADFDGRVALVFTRSGFGWKLTGMEPVSAQDEVNASARPPQPSDSSEVSDRRAAAQKYLAMMNSESGGSDPSAFLALPEIKAAVSKLFENEPKIKTPNGEIDVENNFTYALSLPEEGFPKVLDDAVILAGCAPHACSNGQSLLIVSLSSKTITGALFEQGGQDVSRITLYGVSSLQNAPAAMREWADNRKSPTRIMVQVAK
jgi:hypothetical protein